MAEFVVLSVVPPSFPNPPRSIPIGILLVASDELRLMFRPNFKGIVAEKDAEILSELAGDFLRLAQEFGAAWVLDYLEDIASNSIRASDREQVDISDVESTLKSLYHRYVLSASSTT
jgi:hypothetical protein